MPWKFKKVKDGHLGQGAQGDVYKVMNEETGEIFAKKRIDAVDAQTGNEVRILSSMSQPINVIRLIHSDLDGYEPYLILELMDGDLNTFITTQNENTIKSKLKEYLRQILRGLVYLHETCRVIHRDLKPDNVLIKKPDIIKIGDFGLARQLGEPGEAYSPGKGSINYNAPEILLEIDTYSCPVDIWSVGCIFAEMVSKKILFETADGFRDDQLRLIFRIIGAPNERTWPGVTNLPSFPKDLNRSKSQAHGLAQKVPGLDKMGLDLLQKMLTLNPDQRITASQALKHPFLK